MNIYDNLAKLARSNTKLANGVRLEVCSDDSIELRFGAWPGCSGGTRYVTIGPDNVAFYLGEGYSQYANVVYGQLGLGAIVNNATVAARHVLWFNGVAYAYKRGMGINLVTGDVIGSAPLTATRVDSKKRFALLKLIKSKIPQAQSYLRVAGITLDQKRKYWNAKPADFIAAVKGEQTAQIAMIPIACQRSWKAGKAPSDPLHACYARVLKQYIEQNRALIYEAGGVVVTTDEEDTP